RRGIATTLIGGFLRNHPSARTIELDIFDGNAAAKQLYSNLGFADQSAQVWLVRPLPVPSTAALIDDGAAATQSYEAYGFSEFSVVLEDAAFRFGRIGASVLRCFTPDSFANDALLGHVRASLPDLREALTIASEAAAVPADARVVARSVRMSASASRVAERVKHVEAQAQPLGSQRDGGGAT
ncbi:MAG TPA: hypothetical protein VIL51_12250, partial [Thermoleophilia bacterium]